jgi:HTH DNA binding domain
LRRLVVEFSADQFEGIRRSRKASVPFTLLFTLLDKVESIEILNVLKMVPGEFAVILRVVLRDPSIKVGEVLAIQGGPGARVETELLESESETAFTVLLRVKSTARLNPSQLAQLGSFPYLSTPFEFKEGKVRVTFVGTIAQVRSYLDNLSRQARLKYRVVSLTDASFPPNSPIGHLTEKQRRVLISAYKLGYYDIPRRITSAELAGKLGLVKSTLSAHVRKAERRLLTELLSEL